MTLEAELQRMRQAAAAPPVTPATPTPPAPTPPAQATPPAATAPVVVTPTTPPNVVVTPGAPGVTRAARDVYAGVYASTPLTGGFAVNNLAYGAMFGDENFIGRFGARLAVDYQPATNAIDGSTSITYNLGEGFLEPYIGAGAGIVWSTDRTNTAQNALDYYAQGLFGANVNFTQTIAVFAELAPKFYFSNQGLGAPAGTNGGFVVGTKFGLKFYF